ncbi:hypothetical protein CCR94_14855 [Rhodoblastus sphagnicola]|uniref:Uncharacterized protein n=1 Tax=Rhodoblastus sphagnicola TaxID=333368 RepID=A0A2S6N4S1_9HYPH|nr:hypothetical protein [Rhodoblastus sphagnicola]MBB4199596.1 hypothetical protein [Rhodoblastus sphagnicola]PPQ29602.1 hypothetical protein CCR94_14855 [Rhodoblastus sphagnicola]
MSRKIFLVVLAALAVLFGLAFVFGPTKFGEAIGLDLSRSGAAAAQLMGAAMLAWGMILWAARRFDEQAQDSILFATGLADAVAAAVVSVATVSEAMNGFGWGLALIFLFGAMGCMAVFTRAPQQEAMARGAGSLFEWPIA